MIRLIFSNIFRVDANITEYHILSKLMPKLINFKKVKNGYAKNGHTDFLVLIIELLRNL